MGRSRLVVLLAVLGPVAASVCPAQSETLTTSDTVGVYATGIFNIRDMQSVPANTSIPGPRWALSATIDTSLASCTVDRSPGSVSFRGLGRCDLGGSAGTTNVANSAQLGPQRFRYHVSGAGSGNVVIDWSGYLGTSPFSYASVSVDNAPALYVSSLGSQVPRRVVVPVRFANGLAVAIEMMSSCASTPRLYDYTISVRFERGAAATITPYGTACGATLTGSDTFANARHQLGFLVRGQPSSLIVVLFGLNPVQIPIFGTNCDQLTDLLNYAALTSNAIGEASFGFDLPAPLQGDVRMQALSLTPVPAVLTASAGLRVQLRD